MNREDKAQLRDHWRDAGYYQVQIMANGTTIARPSPQGPWIVLETPFSTRRTLEALKAGSVQA